MTTFAALGDSITLGLGDPAPAGAAGEWRGWAALLADGLPRGRLHNLATTGARAADVERTQLPRALELRPNVASVVVGINDTLRPGFDPVRVHAALAHVAGSLSAAGAMVLTMRLPDPGRMLGMPAALARPLARRINELNGSLDQVAERFGTLHFDAAHDSLVYDRRMWSGMGAAPVHGPGSLPAGDGGAGVLGAAAGAAGAAGAGRTARPGAGGIGPSWHRRGARPAD